MILKKMSVNVKCRSAYFLSHEFLCQNSSFFIIEENRFIFESTESIDFLQSNFCFSYKFVRNSLKFYQQTQKTLDLQMVMFNITKFLIC